MKIFIILFSMINFSFGESKKSDFYIHLNKCSKIINQKESLNPLINGAILFSNEKLLSCDRFNKIYFCSWVENGSSTEKGFFSIDTKKDKTITEAFGTLEKDESFIIKDKFVFYQSVIEFQNNYIIEICDGFYIDDLLKKRTRIFNSNLGLKNIFNSLGD